MPGFKNWQPPAVLSVLALFPIDADDGKAHLQAVAVNIAQNGIAVHFGADFFEPVTDIACLLVTLTSCSTHARHQAEDILAFLNALGEHWMKEKVIGK